MIVLYPANTQIVTITLQDVSTTPPTWINGASVSATLFDPEGVSVPGATGLVGVYVPASNGVYQFTVAGASFKPAPGGAYTLSIAYGSDLLVSVPAYVLTRTA